MHSQQLDEIKTNFEGEFDSLERDSYRAFTNKIEITHSLGAGAAPFLITLFCMSTLDLFSSAYYGYSEVKDVKGRIRQTPKMVNFLGKYLGYDKNVSRLAIKIFRHSLVHLSEPMPTDSLGWEIASNQASEDHWTIQTHNLKGDRYIRFGVTERLKILMDMVKEQEQKEKDPVYKKAKQLKKLKVLELEKLLKKVVEKGKYINLQFDKPQIGRFVIIPFTAQDVDKKREEYDSRYNLRKLIKTTLEKTNWRLMSEGINYRLGYLSGKLKGYENEEDLIKIFKKQ